MLIRFLSSLLSGAPVHTFVVFFIENVADDVEDFSRLTWMLRVFMLDASFWMKRGCDGDGRTMFFTNAEPLSDCVRLPDIAAPGTVPHAAQTGRYALSPATCCSFFSLPSRRYYTEIRLCARAISFLRSDPSLFFSLSIAPFLFCPLASFFFIPPSFMYVRFALLLGIDIHIICIRRESGSSSFSIPRAAQKSPKLSCRISFRVFCP